MGVRVAKIAVLNPGIGIEEVPLKQVLSVVAVGFEVGSVVENDTKRLSPLVYVMIHGDVP